MRILREYVLNSIFRNKRTSAAVFTALFLMTSLMSCFCGLVYTMWTDAVFLDKREYGDWHGELFDDTYGRDLEKIKNYYSVSAMLIKGPWEVAKLSGSGRRMYIIQRPANEEYWDSMPENHLLLEGRVPRSDTELALSKQYFEDHPGAQLGDTLTLPVGERMYNGTRCPETDVYRDGETFRQTGAKTYTLVGKIDFTTSSIVPAYTGMSYFDEKEIKADEPVTVYLRFQPMRSTYRELPALAESVGYEKDEYGDYTLRYNANLLSKYLIFPPEQEFSMGMLAIPLMFAVLCLLLVGVFVFIIHNAFALSFNEKVEQFGTFACVGASPRQTLAASQAEALFLILPSLPPGLAVGWFLNRELFANINAHNDIGRSAPDIAASFGLPAILPAILLSLLTACLSARIPAKKLARSLPVEIMKQGDERLKKPRNFRFSPISSWFGIIGELSANALAHRRRSYRTASISLCLSFLLLTSFLTIFSVEDTFREVYGRLSPGEEQVYANIGDGQRPTAEFLTKLVQVPGSSQCVAFNKLTCAVWVSEEDASSEIRNYLGGFRSIVDEGKYSLIERDDSYRVRTTLVGLEENCFREYCEKLGIDPQPYFEDISQAIFYNYTRDPHASTNRNTVRRELLALEEGQTLPFTERAYDEDEGNYNFTLHVGKLTDTLPCQTLYSSSHFVLTAVMPMEHVLKLSDSCSEKRQNSARSLTAVYRAEGGDHASDAQIEKLTDNVEGLISYYYGSGDYLVSDIVEQEKMTADMRESMNMIISFLTAFLAAIGLSNVWAGISGNLRQRRREFAMLRSVGLNTKQMWAMLFLEGLTLGLKPLLYSLPFQALFLAVCLRLQELTLMEYLPFAPIGVLLGYTVLVLAAVVGAYAIGGRRLQKENIILAVKDDTL